VRDHHELEALNDRQLSLYELDPVHAPTITRMLQTYILGAVAIVLATADLYVFALRHAPPDMWVALAALP
jgi:hypothetical protein